MKFVEIYIFRSVSYYLARNVLILFTLKKSDINDTAMSVFVWFGTCQLFWGNGYEDPKTKC
jgi:hypothetical protein